MTDKDPESRPLLTIVGGQPRKGSRSLGKIKVPVGLEKVLLHAVRDEKFKKRLLDDQAQAISESGIRLRPSEEAILGVIPDAALETMIAGIVLSKNVDDTEIEADAGFGKSNE
ncbi:MAG: hypothetical protein GY854_21295 [Deltaproteobacteria bacterium]|nr:hypothetical protein [Deltaproteobacteria bacterium]